MRGDKYSSFARSVTYQLLTGTRALPDMSVLTLSRCIHIRLSTVACGTTYTCVPVLVYTLSMEAKLFTECYIIVCNV